MNRALGNDQGEPGMHNNASACSAILNTLHILTLTYVNSPATLGARCHQPHGSGPQRQERPLRCSPGAAVACLVQSCQSLRVWRQTDSQHVGSWARRKKRPK
jgi:hypothetical protein